MAELETLKGKQKVFEGTFKWPAELSSEDEALKVLNVIRHSHPSSQGWVEIAGYVKPLPNGKWCAIRHHAQYK